MSTLRIILVTLIIGILPSVLAFAQPQTIYTIQIASSTNLKMAQKLFIHISRLLPLPVRLEKIGRYYVIRAGVTEKKADLMPHLENLKKLGYSQAFLCTAYYLKEHIISEIDSSKRPLEKRQPYLLKLTQKEQPGTGLIRMPEVKKVPSAKPKPKPPYKGKYYLSKAWRYYKARNYNKAFVLFKKALKYPATRIEANLGLAYCYLKQNRPEKAFSLFEKLVKKQFRLKETLPNLIALLLQKGDYTKASLYLTKLRGKERKKWQIKIEKALLKQKFQQAQKTKDIKSLIKLTQTYEKELKHCVLPDLFYNTAQILAQSGGKKEAITIYRHLLSACLHDPNLRLGIIYKLKSLLPPATLQALIEKEINQTNLPLAYKQKLTELKLYLLKERLTEFPPSAPEIEKLAKEILAIKPQDPSTLTALAWWYYHHKQYQSAYKIFSQLHKQHPQKRDYGLGLAYSLIKLNKLDAVLKIAKKFNAQDKAFKQVKSEIYLRKANKAYKNKNYPEAKSYLQKLLTLDPQNLNAKALLAWTLYNQEKIEEALPLLLSVYETQKDPNIARVILHSYEKTNKKKKAFSFAEYLARLDDDAQRKVAGNFFFTHDCPIKAAQVYAGHKTCYYHADKPQLDLSLFYRYKSGTSGFSRLNEIISPFSFSYPSYWGEKWEFSLITKRLFAGNAPPLPYAGSYYKNTTQKNDLITSLWVVSPQIRWEKEGDTHYTFQLGTTPLNGPISPLPTFLAQAEQRHWRFNLHQYPVEESILSYVGLKDPYSDEKWGRVVRSGVEGEIVFNLPLSYWLSLKGGYDNYWGKNVWDNYALYGTTTFGKTFLTKKGKFSLGIFATEEHFQHNTEFFTYGHGGYFSPQAFLMTGPIFHFQTKPCQTYWLDAQLGLGYLYSKTKGAPRYPLTDIHTDLYSKDKASDLGYSIQLQGLRLLSPHWTGGVFFSLNKSADYSECLVGLTLRYFFAPHSMLLSPKR